MTNHIPVSLPFIGKLTRIGLPYHGLVRNSTLILPNNKQITYPNVDTDRGDVTLIRHPAAEENIELTKYDTDNGLQWLDRAYISGKRLGGVLLTNNAIRSWIYCTDTKAFLIDARTTGATTFTFFAREFGRFGEPKSKIIQIGSGVFTPKNYQGAVSFYACTPTAVTHSQDGKITVINMVYITTYYAPTSYYVGAVKVEISGDSLENLAATFSVLAHANNLIEVQESISGRVVGASYNTWPGGCYLTTGDGLDYVTTTTPISNFNCAQHNKRTAKSTHTATPQWSLPQSGYDSSYSRNVYKLNYFVLPDGTINWFEAEHKAGRDFTSNYSIVGAPMDPGLEHECGITCDYFWTWINTCTDTKFQPPNSNEISYDQSHVYTSNTFQGTFLLSGIHEGTKYQFGTYFTRDHYYNSMLTWVLNGDSYENFIYHWNHPGKCTVITTDVCVTLGVPASGSCSPPSNPTYIRAHNNNILDFYLNISSPSVSTYSGSMTIFGQKFSRKISGTLREAVVDPHTQTIYIGNNSSEKLSFV
jgi:hypothetical protein